MKLTSAISILLSAIATTSAAASPKNITYNVISINETVGVVIENHTYPLTKINKNSNLLHSGEAPTPSNGYKYAILDNNNEILLSENFTRTTNETEMTLNEYFGRSWNTYPLVKLPKILPPLPVINRIQSNLHIDGQIPTIHFIGNQAQIDAMHKNQTGDTEIFLNMTYISPNDLQAFHNISLSISGHSTRGLSKLSYKIKLDKKNDLYGYTKFKLRGMATDASYMREKLVYEMADSIGLPVPGNSYARLYINNQAIGLFGFANNLKSPWTRNEFGNGKKKSKQGALYIADPSMGQGMFDGSVPFAAPNTTQNFASQTIDMNISIQSAVSRSTSDLSYLGNNVTAYSLGQYSVKEDSSVDTANFTRIMDLTRFISQQPNTTSTDKEIPLWQEKIDVDSFLRGLAFEIVVSDSDGYFTLGNNWVLYDDVENERLVFSGQDFDLTMGTTFYNVSLMHGGNYTRFPGFQQRPIIAPLMAVPKFKKDFEHLLLNITKSLVNPIVLNPRMDGLVGMLKEDVAWDRSLPRVGNDILLQSIGQDAGNFIDRLPFEQMVNGPSIFNISLSLKPWLELRSSNLLSFFNQTSIV